MQTPSGMTSCAERAACSRRRAWRNWKRRSRKRGSGTPPAVRVKAYEEMTLEELRRGWIQWGGRTCYQADRVESTSAEEQIWRSFRDFRKGLCSRSYQSWRRFLGDLTPVQARSWTGNCLSREQLRQTSRRIPRSLPKTCYCPQWEVLSPWEGTATLRVTEMTATITFWTFSIWHSLNFY